MVTGKVPGEFREHSFCKIMCAWAHQRKGAEKLNNYFTKFNCKQERKVIDMNIK